MTNNLKNSLSNTNINKTIMLKLAVEKQFFFLHKNNLRITFVYFGRAVDTVISLDILELELFKIWGVYFLDVGQSNFCWQYKSTNPLFLDQLGSMSGNPTCGWKSYYHGQKSIHHGWKLIHPGWKSNRHGGQKSYHNGWKSIHRGLKSIHHSQKSIHQTYAKCIILGPSQNI